MKIHYHFCEVCNGSGDEPYDPSAHLGRCIDCSGYGVFMCTDDDCTDVQVMSVW